MTVELNPDYDPFNQCPECSDQPCRNPDHLANQARYWNAVHAAQMDRADTAEAAEAEQAERLQEVEASWRQIAEEVERIDRAGQRRGGCVRCRARRVRALIHSALARLFDGEPQR